MVSLSAPELEESYEEMILEQKRLYSQVRTDQESRINDVISCLYPGLVGIFSKFLFF